MRKRKVEINIISAEGLKLSSLFGKPHSYAVIWVHPKKKFYTHVDQEGGSNPVWNHKLVMSIDSHALEHAAGKFTVEIFHRGHIHDRAVGTVEIPFQEIPHEARRNHEFPSEIQYMAFEIRRPSGKPKGILNLSIRLRESHHSCSSSSSSSDSDAEPRRPRREEALPRVEPTGYPPEYPYQPAYSSSTPSYPPGYPSPAPPYAPPPPPAYSYPAAVPPEYYNPYSSGRQGHGGGGHSNLALGAGIAAGALGGLVLGEVVEDIAEHRAEEAVENVEYGDDDF